MRSRARVMAHANRVLRSIETDDGGRCVDLFARPDGTFGFEEYRRIGSMKDVKEQGLLRLEGKTYVVQDGDIIEIL